MHGLVVDDDDFVRFLLVRTLRDVGLESIDDASSAAAAMQQASLRGPDLAILDLDLGPGPTGIDLAHGLRRSHPAVGVVILSSYADPRLLGANRELPEGGVYLSKGSVGDLDVLTQALKQVIDTPRGRRPGSPEARVAGRRLSDSQIAVMRLVAEGHSNAEIARRRQLTERAVEKSIARLIRQLDLAPGRDSNARVLITQAYFALTGSAQVRRE